MIGKRSFEAARKKGPGPCCQAGAVAFCGTQRRRLDDFEMANTRVQIPVFRLLAVQFDLQAQIVD